MKINLIVETFFTTRDRSGNVYSKTKLTSTRSGKAFTFDGGWGSSDGNALSAAMSILRFAGLDGYSYHAVKIEDMSKKEWNSIETDSNREPIGNEAEIARIARLLGFRKGVQA